MTDRRTKTRRCTGAAGTPLGAERSDASRSSYMEKLNPRRLTTTSESAARSAER